MGYKSAFCVAFGFILVLLFCSSLLIHQVRVLGDQKTELSGQLKAKDADKQSALDLCHGETQAAETKAELAAVAAADFQGAALEMVIASCGHMKKYHPEVFYDWRDTCNEASQHEREFKNARGLLQ